MSQNINNDKIKKESNAELKGIDFKNCTCYYEISCENLWWQLMMLHTKLCMVQKLKVLFLMK